MKKLLIALFVLSAACLYALPTGKSFLYADSYMLRSNGIEAVYTNPALLNPQTKGVWLPLINGGIYVANNSISLKTYNDFFGSGSLDEEEKAKFLQEIESELVFHSESHHSLYGGKLQNYAYALSFHTYANASMQKEYLELMLNGNAEEEYHFGKGANNGDVSSFIDFTVGMGDISVNIFKDKLPPIKFGYSGSLLVGVNAINTKSFKGHIISNLDGLDAESDVVLRSGVGGIGFKGLVGLVSNPTKNTQVGLSLDNVLGFIDWSLSNNELKYNVVIDSVYISDLEEDFYTYNETRHKSSGFTTIIPPELRIAGIYHGKNYSLSLDVVQGFADSFMTSATPRIAMGLEAFPMPLLPLHLGFATGNNQSPWHISYGTGLKLKHFELGFGVQSFQSLFPGYNTKGVSFATYCNIDI